MTFIEGLKVSLISYCNFNDVSELATAGLFKIKVFVSKGYDFKISVYDVTNKILSCDTNSIVDAFTWPMFGTVVFLWEKFFITSITS